jgi:hypothetical protein
MTGPHLSRALDSACLITGGPDEPDLDVLVRPNGDVLRVTLDDLLDRDEFVVRATESFAPASASA